MKSNNIRRIKAYRDAALKVLRDARLVRNTERLSRSLIGMSGLIDVDNTSNVPQEESPTRKLIQAEVKKEGVKNVTSSNQ